jgi:hypothetical protein
LRVPNTEMMQVGHSGGEVWRDVENAAQVWAELGQQGQELSFELDPRGGVLITLRDSDGHVVRGVSASEAVEIASTAPGPGLDRLLRS